MTNPLANRSTGLMGKAPQLLHEAAIESASLDADEGIDPTDPSPPGEARLDADASAVRTDVQAAQSEERRSSEAATSGADAEVDRIRNLPDSRTPWRHLPTDPRERFMFLAVIFWPAMVGVLGLLIETGLLIEPMNELLSGGKGLISTGTLAAVIVTTVGILLAHLRGRSDHAAEAARAANDAVRFERYSRLFNLCQFVLIVVAGAALGARIQNAILNKSFDLWGLVGFACFQIVLLGFALALPLFAVENHREHVRQLLDDALRSARAQLANCKKDEVDLASIHAAQLETLARITSEAKVEFRHELGRLDPLLELPIEVPTAAPADNNLIGNDPGNDPDPGNEGGGPTDSGPGPDPVPSPPVRPPDPVPAVDPTSGPPAMDDAAIAPIFGSPAEMFDTILGSANRSNGHAH